MWQYFLANAPHFPKEGAPASSICPSDTSNMWMQTSYTDRENNYA